MYILKFGGTSVGSAERMKALVNLISSPEEKIVVLSAMSGTTNALVEICNNLYNKESHKANELINQLEKNIYTKLNFCTTNPSLKPRVKI